MSFTPKCLEASTSLALLGGVALAAACSTRPAESAGPDPRSDAVVPMREEPYHRLVLQNQRVAVYDVVLPLDAVMKFHEHPTNHLAIVIDSGRMENEILGRPPKLNPTGASGMIVYLPAGPPHRQTNVGQTAVRFVAIEVLADSPEDGPSAAPGPIGESADRRAAPDGHPGCRVAIEASDVRAWRCRLAAGESAPARAGERPFLRVPLSRGALQPAGAGASRRLIPGVAEWHEEGESAEATNAGAVSLEYVDLEWK